MKKMKSFLTLAMTSLLAFSVLAGCGQGTAPTPADQAQGGQAGQPAAEQPVAKLRMATSADYKPYEYHDTSSGEDKIVGFDIDIANYIAKELGFELEIVDMDFNGIIPSLQSGRAEFAMAGMTPKPERLKNADFSVIYFEATNSIVSKKDANLTKVSELAGKTVGVQLGSIQEGEAKVFAEGEAKGMKIKQMNKIAEIIQELKAGRIDAAIIEDTVAKGFVKNNEELQFTKIESAEPAGSAVAFPKGSEQVEKFNEVIKKMQENGELEKLIQKWFGE
ncbi:transporter substrate-binding domain-containing protein [Brevibacillus dissolubilis]|uniref:transporter substrate-binding domain-containing protein n=1 Tax=Brevibacillus dissolubilis TaxID=1844116 RepID=UPI001115BE81|nr:transporter substrate-binding domain-containing protein [Brevibacillus dissolubilis]